MPDGGQSYSSLCVHLNRRVAPRHLAAPGDPTSPCTLSNHGSRPPHSRTCNTSSWVTRKLWTLSDMTSKYYKRALERSLTSPAVYLSTRGPSRTRSLSSSPVARRRKPPVLHLSSPSSTRSQSATCAPARRSSRPSTSSCSPNQLAGSSMPKASSIHSCTATKRTKGST